MVRRQQRIAKRGVQCRTTSLRLTGCCGFLSLKGRGSGGEVRASAQQGSIEDGGVDDDHHDGEEQAIHAVEDTATVLLRFTNGALATLSATDAVPSPDSLTLDAFATAS